MEGIGHVRACTDLAESLADRGHQIAFLISSDYRGDYRKLGYDELVYVDEEKPRDPDLDSYDKSIHPVLPPIVERLKKSIVLQHRTPKEKLELRDNAMFKRIYETQKRMSPKIEALIGDYRPDLIIVDHFIIPPCITFNRNVPWVFLFSGNPDFLYNSAELPPPMSGLPTNDRSEWDDYRCLFYEKYQKPMQDYQNLLNTDLGYPAFPADVFFNKSSHLNLYGYPAELDYTDRVARPENFLQLDGFYRCRPAEPYRLPEPFRVKVKPGDKLIYVSLGSCGAVDVELMKAIVEALRDSPHKFIVSKGPLHDQYRLAEGNMHGESWLPQRQIIPMVDAVLMHGGNNTLVECMQHGKPMVVMPLFFDQYSNAQRIQEKRFGVRVDPYTFTRETLQRAIDQVLTDAEIIDNLRRASERLKKSQSVSDACARLEEYVQKSMEDKKEKTNIFY